MTPLGVGSLAVAHDMPDNLYYLSETDVALLNAALERERQRTAVESRGVVPDATIDGSPEV